MIGRNDPCPCGSGKKFKKCHMGQEDGLVLDQMETLPEGAAEKITALAEVRYGGSGRVLDTLDLEKLTGSRVALRFVDLGEYLSLGLGRRKDPQDLGRQSAGQMINPMKTLSADPDHVYLAISPAVSDSTLIHTVAHALDYLAGSRLNPSLAGPLALELDLPPELLEHPQEFGRWLRFLANELGVALDAEDTIVTYLHENGLLIPGEVLGGEDHVLIDRTVRKSLDFIRTHRADIDQRIRNRQGYRADQAPRETAE
jgi:hypothetical protein